MHRKSEFLYWHFLKRSPLDGGCFSSLRFTPHLETPLHNSKVSWLLPLHRFLRQPVNEINGRILREAQVRLTFIVLLNGRCGWVLCPEPTWRYLCVGNTNVSSES